MDHGDGFYIRTNSGARDFKIVFASGEAPQEENWRDVVPHRDGNFIADATLFRDYLVVLAREDSRPRLTIHDLGSGETNDIAFEEETYALGFEPVYEFDSRLLRFSYSSMARPKEILDADFATRARTLVKRQEVPGFDPENYLTRLLFARAEDGESVPVSLLMRRDAQRDGSAPLLLTGYGAYGYPVEASFSSNRLSLVDRGFIYAIAHVRGGTDKGWRWYEDGKLLNKPNTFGDFLAAARHLVADGYTSAGRIVAQGGSAGGLLMGAVANMAPDLFAGIIADVPFVDALATMLDESLPLTPPEWLEWGDPIRDRAAFEAIRSYSPYDNVRSQRYPAILALAGLADPRVTYWEPAKWVAKLRATMTGGGPVLLRTAMEAGHARPGGAVRPARRRGPHLRLRHRLRQRKIAGPAGLKWRSNANIRKAQKCSLRARRLLPGGRPNQIREEPPFPQKLMLQVPRIYRAMRENPSTLTGRRVFPCYGGKTAGNRGGLRSARGEKTFDFNGLRKNAVLSEQEENRATNREIIRP